MALEHGDDDFVSVNEANYKKISDKLEKMGYKDGKHDGRESQFQASFDVGYESGFKNGFLLGKYRATNVQNTAKDQQLQQPTNDLILQRVSRGQCILCTDKSLLDGDMNGIIENQKTHIDKIRSTLESRYQ